MNNYTLHLNQSEYKCSYCGRPILEGRAHSSKYMYGKFICGNKQYGSLCVDVWKEEQKELTNPH